MIENNQLVSLIAIEQTGSFSKAAERLQVTQSAISQAMKNLEGKLGFTLVVRDKKEVQLTSEGKRICILGKKYLRDYEELIHSFHQERQELVGEYILGTLDGIGKSFISKYFLEFLKDFPEVDLQVQLDLPENLVTKYKRRMVQALILPEHLVPASMERHTLFEEQLCLVVHPDILNGSDINNLDLNLVKKMPFIFFEEQDPNFYRWSRELYKQVPKGIKPRLVFNSYTPIINAIVEKIGAAVIPSHILERPHVLEQCKHLAVSKKIFLSKVCFAHSSDLADDLKTKQLLKHLKSKF